MTKHKNRYKEKVQEKQGIGQWDTTQDSTPTHSPNSSSTTSSSSTAHLHSERSTSTREHVPAQTAFSNNEMGHPHSSNPPNAATSPSQPFHQV
ncbi:uncharacterized protein G2W53_018280 [Senna tora]|uniref:Uncharacterized protein n=1 Tax=Senna tora TaxID=362788 RepID=A0A834TUX0_9FABA|nr:uncharacterized protein G2W53_018280 [Senna tora]